jgi:hypothetical protein
MWTDLELFTIVLLGHLSILFTWTSLVSVKEFQYLWRYQLQFSWSYLQWRTVVCSVLQSFRDVGTCFSWGNILSKHIDSSLSALVDCAMLQLWLNFLSHLVWHQIVLSWWVVLKSSHMHVWLQVQLSGHKIYYSWQPISQQWGISFCKSF